MDGPAARPPRRRKLAEIARDQMLSNIRSGRWKVGDRIPTEQALTVQFGMSRAPVREAVQSLTLLGILDVAPRRGAFVQALPSSSVVDLGILSSVMRANNPIADLFEFRAGTEGAIAELAARNASGAQIRQLRSIIDANVAAVVADDAAELRQVDVAFHAAVSVASGNVVYQGVVAALSGLLTDLRRTIGGIPGASSEAMVEHRAILDSIARHDTSAARLSAELHVRNTEVRFRRAELAQPSRSGEATEEPSRDPP
ncbi:MAG: FadR family transcriptional regulator [Chloroflexi bacterium]|nr:FadR family transcriptional regulator [Chloroflexota bacterium]